MKQKELARIGQQIRRTAIRNDLTATSRTHDDGYGNRFRKWWFGNEFTNPLESSETGLTDEDAVTWLCLNDLNEFIMTRAKTTLNGKPIGDMSKDELLDFMNVLMDGLSITFGEIKHHHQILDHYIRDAEGLIRCMEEALDEIQSRLDDESVIQGHQDHYDIEAEIAEIMNAQPKGPTPIIPIAEYLKK